VYAAYNYWAGPKDIREWAFNDHDGAISHHAVEQLAYLRELFTD
jgi:cephalosporin-C deacetylase